jgi:hypothetical protein
MIHGLVVMNPDHFTVKGDDPAGFLKILAFMKQTKAQTCGTGDAKLSLPHASRSCGMNTSRSLAQYVRILTPAGNFPLIPDTSFKEIQQQWK